MNIAKWTAAAAPLALVAGMASASPAQAQATPATPPAAAAAKDDASGTMKRADPDMRRVLQKLMELGAKPLDTLSVEQARKQPSPADAVKALMHEGSKTAAAPKVKKQDVMYPAAAGQQAARVYTPEGQAPQGGWPVIVYYHGGGWVIADLDTYDATPLALAEKAKALVVSIDYRHAPESKFPAAHEDSFAGYKWVLANAEKWGANPRNVAVAGESAGGNLAINMAMMARDQNLQKPVHMLLVYPVAGIDMETASYKQNADATPLSKKGMQWFVEKIFAKPDDKNSPMIDLVGKADVKNLPEATIITAEIDPLMSEGAALADKLKKAGVTVHAHNYKGSTHEFFGMADVVKDAADAQGKAAGHLRDAFAQADKMKTGPKM